MVARCNYISSLFTVWFAVDETTTDIICIKCKKDDSDSPNEIVLCDKCGIGKFHLNSVYRSQRTVTNRTKMNKIF